MDEKRAALIIGIDHYKQPQMELLGCVKDACDLARKLKRNEDQGANFDLNVMTSLDRPHGITTDAVESAITDLFNIEAKTLLFYFAGHSFFCEKEEKGYFVTQDADKRNKGVSFDFLLHLANKAYPKVSSVTILIDSCNSGAFGDAGGALNDTVPATIGTGVSILMASDRCQKALEDGFDGGFFSRVVIDGLNGSAADIRGNVTPASLYSHADQLLSLWEQRPIFKANVKSFIPLRKCKPKLSLEQLNALPDFFPDAHEEFKLNPTFEPDRKNIPEQYRHLPVNPENVRKFKILQACNRQGLVVPVDEEHMFDAAINSKTCKLTELGKHYRLLAQKGRLK